MTNAILQLSPAHKHTHCTVGISLIRAALEVLEPALRKDKKASAMIAKVQRWVEECSIILRDKKVSSGAKHDMDKHFTYVGKFIDACNGDGEKRLHVWTAVLWAGNTIIFDCRRFCTEVTKGKPCWLWLDQTTETLGKFLNKFSPTAEDFGFEMYKHITPDAKGVDVEDDQKFED